MSFKIRNSIVLAALWFLITAAGLGYWMWWQPRHLKVTQTKITAISKQLDDLPALTDEVQKLTVQYQDVKRRYDSRSKEVPQSDASTQTYAYLSTALDEIGFMKFDMRFIGTEKRNVWGYNAYKLEAGEAQFNELYKLMYFIENGARLYKIANVRFTQNEVIDNATKETKQSILFEMEIHAYFVGDIPELGTSLAAKSLTSLPSPFDPFKPLIYLNLATDSPPGEINAEKAELKAVLPGKAFVFMDNELVVLHLGDKVWRGYVSKIDPANSSVEFTLDEGGVLRTLEKKIQFDRKLRPRGTP